MHPLFCSIIDCNLVIVLQVHGGQRERLSFQTTEPVFMQIGIPIHFNCLRER